jgi:hypothetical protein
MAVVTSAAIVHELKLFIAAFPVIGNARGEKSHERQRSGVTVL